MLQDDTRSLQYQVFSCSPDRSRGPHNLLYNGYWIFFGVKEPEPFARHRPPPSTGLRTCWNYISTSPLCLRRHVMGGYTKHYFIDRKKVQTPLCRLITTDDRIV